MPDQEQYGQGYVFALWAEQFDETIATTFITEFRKLGLRAKVVGLDGNKAKGRYGLGLLIDMTLGEAVQLAEHAICIIVPCRRANLRRVSADPRLHILLALAFANNKCILITWQDTLPDLIAQCQISAESIYQLPEDQRALLDMAERIGKMLVPNPSKFGL